MSERQPEGTMRCADAGAGAEMMELPGIRGAEDTAGRKSRGTGSANGRPTAGLDG